MMAIRVSVAVIGIATIINTLAYFLVLPPFPWWHGELMVLAFVSAICMCVTLAVWAGR